VGTYQSLDRVEGVQEALHQLPLAVVSQDPKAGGSELPFGEVQVPPPFPAHAQHGLQFLLHFQNPAQSQGICLRALLSAMAVAPICSRCPMDTMDVMICSFRVKE
jgi:hypothetical protein